MEKKGTYRTILAPGEGFYKEKGSKFLAYAVPCKTEDEVKKHLAAWRKEHFQAVHVCYAFRLGSDKKVFRASDDGEPSNSAGPPILGQIQSFDLTNLLIGVVRYYGGTNLGVGGLINAYRTAAKEALEQATIVEEEDHCVVELLFEYDHMPAVMAVVKAIPLQVMEQQFELSCRLKGSYPVSNEQARAQLQELKNVELIEHGIRT
ncbi:MAG TPA: YigZ family protein [Fluviicola sp.]|nr:YigZ family protein [Fluviicola sp.]